MAAPQPTQSKAKDRVILVVLMLIVTGTVLGAGFYQEELGGYWRLQGWNLGPLKEAARQFLEAAAAGDGARVAGMIKTPAQQLTPVLEGGKLTAFMVGDNGGPQRRTLKALAPSGNFTLMAPKLSFQNGGSVRIAAEFPDHVLEMLWDRTNAGWKLIGLSWQAK